MTGSTAAPEPVRLERDAAGGWIVDATIIAPGLGLTPGLFMHALQQGLVFQTHEVGTGADTGSYRLTFRYRAREWRLIVAEDGRVLTAEPGPHDPRRLV